MKSKNFGYDKQENNNKISSNIDMPQFFSLASSLSILNPYNFKEAIERLEKLSDEEIINDLSHFANKNWELTNIDDNLTFNINSVSFLSSRLSSDENILVELENMNNYISNSNIKLNIQNNLRRSDIQIKLLVDYKKFTKNIYENMCKKSIFKSGEKLINKIEAKQSPFNDKKCEFDIQIKINSINEINYTDDGIYIIDLQHPPLFKTNFLIDRSRPNSKDYESIVFPFKNFDDEIANLKYRKMYVMIKKYNETPKEDSNGEVNFLSALENIFQEKNKLKHLQEIKSISEIEMKKISNYRKNMELSQYFKYNSDDEIKKIFLNLGFLIKKSENEIKNEEEKNNNEKVDIYDDLYIIKFNYLLLALISENIISYYNSILFIEKFLYDEKDNYKNTIFKNADNYPLLFCETLNKILDTYQGQDSEFNLNKFEEELENKYKIINADYISKGEKYITRASNNPKLIRIQRSIITPTFTLFTPYVLDQGNRVLRKFLKTPYYGMICVFKTNDFSEDKWNNKFLIEFIKFILSKGLFLGEKQYTFFDFSQSQFRNMSCWLIIDPEKILPKTGDYSKINIVAKYGARISQTLTTTVETTLIPKENIKEIPEVEILDENGNNKYTFSDGVGKISVEISKKIAESQNIKGIPSAFQGRFLGCKGVWTTMYDDHSGNIYIRPSQTKFGVEKKDFQYFELCEYSRYIQAYLNRQIIMLLSALNIPDEVFMNKLNEYKNRLEDEKFVLSLIHYDEWNSMFRDMYLNGINMSNDRLINSLVENNKNLLYNDLKNKARIYIEKSAYVMGIMDEFGILEYGEAYCHIQTKTIDLILNQKCSVAKCPCLHPGDIRVLNFKKYDKDDENTKKYKCFEPYINVIIFPQKGKRPHPNECSGSDLDGDDYFVFYDKELIPKETVEPMDYTAAKAKKIKKNIKLKNIIKYFAEYINLNNLGIIGDAHYAMVDQDPKGADGEIPKSIAKKFSQAVDAPKTGVVSELTDDETPKRFPHFMDKNKTKKNVYYSHKILGKLYDKIKDYLNELQNNNTINNYYDNDLCLLNWENYGFIALSFYKEYYLEILSLMKKNEIKVESVLLTGNNMDNDESLFSKKKHNYDIREKVTAIMVSLFTKFNEYFSTAMNYFFDKVGLGDLNNEDIFQNNLNNFASACYMVSYNLKEIISKLNQFKINFESLVEKSIRKDNDYNDICDISEYEMNEFGIDFYESLESNYDNYSINIAEKLEKIKDVINKFYFELKQFCDSFFHNDYKLPKDPNDENQYRILSFPWCIAGKMLSTIKKIA